MSLLSGIRFVSKGERSLDEDGSSKKHEKKEKKHSKKRKHHKESKKDRKSKKEESDDNSSSDGSDNRNTKHAKKENYDWRSDLANNGNEDDDFNFEEFLEEERKREEVPKQKIDRWKAGYDFEDDEADNERFNTERTDTYQARDDEIPSVPSHKSYEREREVSNAGISPKSDRTQVIPPPPPSGPSNKNIAALLRSKLKTTSKALEAEEIEEIRHQQQAQADLSPAEYSNDNILESIQYNKEYQLLKQKYRQLNQNGENKKSGGSDLLATAKEQRASKNVLSSLKSGYDGDNMDQIYANNILRLKGNYKGSELLSRQADGSGFTEEDNIDMTLFQRAGGGDGRKGGERKGGKGGNKVANAVEETASDLKRQIQDSIKEQNKMVQLLRQCQWCYGNPSFPSHLIFGQSEHLILRIKSHQYSLTDGHFEIVPKEHVSSYLQFSEEAKTEIERTISCIQHMYDKVLKKNVVLFETVIRLHQKPHTVIEVLPIEKGMENDVQMFFREVKLLGLSLCQSNVCGFILIV